MQGFCAVDLITLRRALFRPQERKVECPEPGNPLIQSLIRSVAVFARLLPGHRDSIGSGSQHGDSFSWPRPVS